MDDHLRRLWRHRGATLPTPRRGPRQQLDLDEILAAGMAIADASGLEAVSTRAVAARFGKTAMALYPYVGTKENLLALMQDQATTMPDFDLAQGRLEEALRAWATALFEVYLAHPWLTERPWSQASQGPHEQDWMEALLGIFERFDVAARLRAPAVTMLYATTRATAQTAAAYERLTEEDLEAWRTRAAAAPSPAVPLVPVTTDWREAPRAGLLAAVALLATGLAAGS
ncbi:TetR/AcrR family transcriptional regulator [Paractinoplanes maris]|uniref:TetR/AcrR family transcriptional regulator n=1 Tax=Paractinoplanes maris TaxID=1734446 RepID=UPI002021934F|nr:TetR family transcriptional regulator [Actinoplanes maris]